MSNLALNGGKKLREKPFHKWPEWDDRDRKAILAVLEDGSWGGYPSPNKYCKKFAEEFAAYSGAKYGICAANGSVTLELALTAAGIGPGDEVIVPAYTFVATASSVVFCHGVPIFVDCDPNTYCIDPKLIEKAITPKTKAIIPVHLGCNMADMDAIMAIAKKHNLVVIEDCAHAHGAQWNGKFAGSIGHLSSFSFQTSKSMTAGEGGIVLTSNKEYEMKIQSLVNCGRKEPGYDKWEGQYLGKNYRISEWSAGILSSQLGRLTANTKRKIEMAKLLQKKLAGIRGLTFTKPYPNNNQQGIYQLFLKYDPAGFNGVHRDKFLKALNAEGIPSEGDFYVPIYQIDIFPMDKQTNPLASLEYAKGYDLKNFHCPVTEKAAYHESIWLPHEIFLGDEKDIEDTANAIIKVQENINELK